MAPDGKLSTFRANSGRTNGNTFDAQGRLDQLRRGRARPRRRPPDRPHRPHYRERRGPDRSIRQASGTIAPTTSSSTPRAGSGSPTRTMARTDHRWRWTPRPSTGSTPTAMVTRVLSQPEIERPNGLARYTRWRTLYVIDCHPQPGGNRKIWAFDVAEDGSLEPARSVFDFGKGQGRRRPPSRRPRQPLGRRRHHAPPPLRASRPTSRRAFT